MIHIYICLTYYVCLVIELLGWPHLEFVGGSCHYNKLCRPLFFLVSCPFKPTACDHGIRTSHILRQARMDNPSLLRFLVTNLSWEDWGSPIQWLTDEPLENHVMFMRFWYRKLILKSQNRMSSKPIRPTHQAKRITLKSCKPCVLTVSCAFSTEIAQVLTLGP